jgi:hypothetical protein
MKRLITTALTLLVFATGAAFAAPPPGQVVQIFGCTLSDGQTQDDVWALADAFAANAATMNNPDDASGLFLWMPYRGATPYDFAFGVLSGDLNSMAAGSAAYQASDGAAAIGARFQAMDGCDSAIMMSDQISEGKIGMTAGDRIPDAVVETFSCNINDGSDVDDWNGAVKFYQDQVRKINSAALNQYQAYQWTPFRGGTGADIVWVGNSPDLKTWAQGETDYANSAAGQAADDRFAKVSTCTNNLWMGYWLVTPEEF